MEDKTETTTQVTQGRAVQRVRRTKSKFREYAEALVTALVIALLLRSFVVEAFKVPSASMLPSILIGDHLFVNKYIYGLRLPLTKKWVTHFAEPQRGEVVVFIYPVDESKDFIKRVVGLPGDHVLVEHDKILINNEEVRREAVQIEEREGRLRLIPPADAGIEPYEIERLENWESFDFYVEYLGDKVHYVQYFRKARPPRIEVVVPEGHLFVMGDNRDRSADSREWGFVPMQNLKGRAMFLWLSLSQNPFGVRLDRFGDWID